MTRKRIAAAFLALVMAVCLTVPALAADSGTRTSLEDYTAENSAHAILDYLTENSTNAILGYLAEDSVKTYDEWYSHDVDHIKTPLGNCEETWTYLRENFGGEIAVAWHNTDVHWKTGAASASDSEGNPTFPVLEYLLNDADRQFAYVRDNYTDYDLDKWLHTQVIRLDATATAYIEPETDAEVTRYCTYSCTPRQPTPVETPEPPTDPTDTLDGPVFTVIVDNEAGTISTLYRNALANTILLTQRDTLTGDVKTTVKNMETGSKTAWTYKNMAAGPVSPTPVKINGTDTLLNAVVLTDANGGATTYFKLRDVGDAVGFDVGWTAQAGITVQKTGITTDVTGGTDLGNGTTIITTDPSNPLKTIYHDDIFSRTITTTRDALGEVIITALTDDITGETRTITEDKTTHRVSTKTTRGKGDAAASTPAVTSAVITVDGQSVQLDAVVLTDANGGAMTYFKLRDLADAVGFQVDWSAATGITVNSK